MLTIEEVKEKYKDILFYQNEPLTFKVLKGYDLVQTIDEVIKDSPTIGYTVLDLKATAATNNILQSAITSYVGGVTTSLMTIWEGTNLTDSDKNDQLLILKEIADQLYNGNSEYSLELRKLAKAKYFYQLGLVNHNTKKVYFFEETDKNEDAFEKIVDRLDQIVNELYLDLIDGPDGEPC